MKFYIISDYMKSRLWILCIRYNGYGCVERLWDGFSNIGKAFFFSLRRYFGATQVTRWPKYNVLQRCLAIFYCINLLLLQIYCFRTDYVWWKREPPGRNQYRAPRPKQLFEQKFLFNFRLEWCCTIKTRALVQIYAIAWYELVILYYGDGYCTWRP